MYSKAEVKRKTLVYIQNVIVNPLTGRTRLDPCNSFLLLSIVKFLQVANHIINLYIVPQLVPEESFGLAKSRGLLPSFLY